jgi:sRNA-binding carbon storage regulator CsrA
MLVLKCRTGSAIDIGRDTRITIGPVSSHNACLIVECPNDTRRQTSLEAAMSESLAVGGQQWDPHRMYALSTEPAPEINIGPTIRVTLLAVNGDSVKIGIMAPDSVSIKRVAHGDPLISG